MLKGPPWTPPSEAAINPVCVCVCTQLCTALCNPMDCRPPGSSVQGILQARVLEWAAISSSRGSSRPRDRTPVSYVSCTGRRVLYHRTWIEVDGPDGKHAR